jgi:hypothetical protein
LKSFGEGAKADTRGACAPRMGIGSAQDDGVTNS